MALKPAERLVIDLLYLQQRSVAEIQTITGWSASLVKVRAFRARQKMKTAARTILRGRGAMKGSDLQLDRLLRAAAAEVTIA